MKRYDFSRLKTLIIEDHYLTKNILMRVLRSFGFEEIFAANSKEQVYQLMREHEIDLVLTEWGESQLEFTSILRMIRTDKNIYNHFVPIVVITNKTEYINIKMARDAGATEFLLKPFTAEILLRRIISVIESPRKFIHSENYIGPDRRRRRQSDYKGGERRKAPQDDHSYTGEERRSGDRKGISHRQIDNKAEEVLLKGDDND